MPEVLATCQYREASLTDDSVEVPASTTVFDAFRGSKVYELYAFVRS